MLRKSLFLVIALVLIVPAAVFGADKLIVQDGSSNNLFVVEDGTSTPNRVLRVLSGIPIMLNTPTAGFDFKNTASTFGGSISVGTGGNPNLYGNWQASSNAKDDVSKISWGARLDIGNDRFRLVRVPANSTTFTGIFEVLGNGSITSVTGASLTNTGIWTNNSSRVVKENISELSTEDAYTAFKGLSPVIYNYKVDKDKKYVGFIAEEVPELVAMKDHKTLSAMDIVAVLTKVVQDKSQVIEKQQTTLEMMAAKLDKMEAEIKWLKSKDYTAQK